MHEVVQFLYVIGEWSDRRVGHVIQSLFELQTPSRQIRQILTAGDVQHLVHEGVVKGPARYISETHDNNLIQT